MFIGTWWALIPPLLAIILEGGIQLLIYRSSRRSTPLQWIPPVGFIC